MQIPRCPKNFSATFICVDINCNQSNPFICHNTQNHDCYLSHQNCNKKKWNQFRYQLEKTKNLAHPQFIKFSKIVQDTISNCIKNLQTQFLNFKMWKLTFGMSPQIIYFLKCLHDNKQKCWTGNQLAQIIEQIEGKQKFKKFDELKIQNFCKKVLDQIQEIKKTIKKMYMSLEQQLQNNYIDINPKFNKLEVIKIDLTRSSVELSKPMIKILPLIQSQSITIKIKQKLLLDLNQRLFNLSQKPTHLELKVSIKDNQCIQINKIQLVYFNHKLEGKKTKIIRSININIISVLIILGRQYFLLKFSRYHNQYEGVINLLIQFVKYEQTSVRYKIDLAVGIIINQSKHRIMQQIAIQQYLLINKCIQMYRYRRNKSQKLEYRLNIYVVVEFHLYQSNHNEKQGLNEMANNLKKSNFKGLRNIILYYPWIIGDNPDFIRCQKQIASAISPIHLPNLVSFTILANDIKSVQGFKVIQNKVQIIREWGWVDKEIW